MPKKYETHKCYRCGRWITDWFGHYCPAYPIKYYRLMFGKREDMVSDEDIIHALIQGETDIW